MSHEGDEELPENVRSVLPEHAQHIYREAFNNACEEYSNPGKRREGSSQSQEEVAHKVAWAAVKQEYEKGSNRKWIKKER